MTTIKNNNFSDKKIESKPIQFESTISSLLRTMNKFTICLNSRSIENISYLNLSKVCFILINTYENEDKKFGIGPLNDGIHVALHYKRLKYKVFYLYNSKSEKFLYYLDFFLQNATKSLTVFYSGLDSFDEIKFSKSSIDDVQMKKNPNDDDKLKNKVNYNDNLKDDSIHDIKFTNGEILKSNIIKKSISKNCNEKVKITFITNSLNGGSVFDIDCENEVDIVSLWVQKKNDSNDCKKSHGTFIYYLFKIINDSPNISPKNLVEKINPLIEKFNEHFKFDVTNADLVDSPLK